MRKIFLLLTVFCLFMTACNTVPDTVDLSDMSQNKAYSEMNKVYRSAEDYDGKAITMKGIYSPYMADDGEAYYRCCIINDSNEVCYIDFTWAEAVKDFPETGTEVVLTGEISVHTDDDIQSVRVVDVTEQE